VPRPRLHVVALAHLDTQWRWTLRDTVRDHLPATVRANAPLFARFPGYVLSFEGAWRYRLLAEHYPQLFAQVREWSAAGRWHPAGGAVEAFDALLPAPESILRQILYGRRWFRRELGVESRDLFHPDCFGFPSILPTLAAHAGIAGFSTQKLRRGKLLRASRPIPFAYGRWRGPDGSEILAALDPGEYSGRIEGDLTRDPEFTRRFAELAACGLPQRLLLYVGTGDRGGAPPESTVARLEAALAGDGPIEIRHGPSEAIYLESEPSERDRLPIYEGELLLRLHATGCYTSKAAVKRWNRAGERLARAAEAAAVAAELAGFPAPRSRFEGAWTAILAHQMHDDLTGTSIPDAYRFSLADLGWAVNELSELLLDGVARAARTLDADGEGMPFLLLSTLPWPGREIVELRLARGEHPSYAVDTEGRFQPLQIVDRGDGERRALVPFRVRGLELARCDLRSGDTPGVETVEAPATARDRELETGRYRARLDETGALASLVDRRLGRELLAAPLRLELLPDRSRKYPAWEIRWEDISAPPRVGFAELVGTEILEEGPLRVALRIERRWRGGSLRETWSLAAEPDDAPLTCEVELDWRTNGALLKLALPLASRNLEARYDTGLGAIARPVSTPALYEVPAQSWAAIEDEREGFAVAVLSDQRSGWDHPDAGTLRSTWIHAPRSWGKYRHQGRQDFGRHHFRFALAGLEAGAIDAGELAQLADRFLHPALPFRIAPRPSSSPRARRLFLVELDAPLRVLALKPTEDEAGALLRLSNPASGPRSLQDSTHPGLATQREVDGIEDDLPEAGRMDDPRRPLPPSGLRSLRCGARRAPPGSDFFRGSTPLPLPWNARGVTTNLECERTGFDGRGISLPSELLPEVLLETPVPFDLDHCRRPGSHLLAAAGQELELGDDAAELWLLAASVAGDRTLTFLVGDEPRELAVPDWRLPFLDESRWRLSWRGRGLRPGSFRRRPVAWSAGHLHDARGRDLPVERATLFALALPCAGARRIRLPRERALRILAATLAREPARSLQEGFLPLAP
jgi:alpha-mannosidase